jgi:hypothetical protein
MSFHLDPTFYFVTKEHQHPAWCYNCGRQMAVYCQEKTCPICGSGGIIVDDADNKVIIPMQQAFDAFVESGRRRFVGDSFRDPSSEGLTHNADHGAAAQREKSPDSDPDISDMPPLEPRISVRTPNFDKAIPPPLFQTAGALVPPISSVQPAPATIPNEAPREEARAPPSETAERRTVHVWAFSNPSSTGHEGPPSGHGQERRNGRQDSDSSGPQLSFNSIRMLHMLDSMLGLEHSSALDPMDAEATGSRLLPLQAVGRGDDGFPTSYPPGFMDPVPTPLSANARVNLTGAKFHREKGKLDQCTICSSSFAEGVKILALPCKHFFHKDCINPWFVSHNNCPLCRATVPDEDDESSSPPAKK